MRNGTLNNTDSNYDIVCYFLLEILSITFHKFQRCDILCPCLNLLSRSYKVSHTYIVDRFVSKADWQGLCSWREAILNFISSRLIEIGSYWHTQLSYTRALRIVWYELGTIDSRKSSSRSLHCVADSHFVLF